jgi:DNA helicase HerA-like ATPase
MSNSGSIRETNYESTILEQISALTIGSVESVAPAEIHAVLDIDAPQTTALNSGVPTGFPRLNGYVLLPNEAGAVVGLVVWLGIERSAFPKRTGLKDFGLIDLPFPIRKMTITPVGTLGLESQTSGIGQRYLLRRGVSIFPSVGDPVLLPTSEQLRSIVESEGKDQRVFVGKSTLAGNARVSVDPDKLFGRHLAVIGNTGSGKSCSVAGLIRWSLEAAAQERAATAKQGPANARFIVLDPNGEYIRTFSDLAPAVRVFKVPPINPPDIEMSMPGWMWNSHEWSAFGMATAATQRPLLLQALRNLRSGVRAGSPVEIRLRNTASTMKAKLERILQEGYGAYAGFPGNKNTGYFLKNCHSEDLASYVPQTAGEMRQALEGSIGLIAAVEGGRRWAKGEGWNDFSEQNLQIVVDSLNTLLGTLPTLPPANVSEDAPLPFAIADLPEHLEQLAAGTSAQMVQFIATLVMRIRMMLSDNRLRPLIGKAPEELSFVSWLEAYIGADGAANGQIAVLDLSLVPSEIVHIVIAVLARLVFEATHRYRKIRGVELPTILILEEAHNFIQQHAPHTEEATVTPIQMCRSVFEKIAREGRKFGLGLVLSSQRPSELSPTVLAQCNTFLLHRIVNDRDQDLIKKLVPDNLAGLLRELPSLPSRQAILLGGATPVPVLVEMRELPSEQQPKSSDPRFWDVWTGAEDRPIDWTAIADDWTR